MRRASRGVGGPTSVGFFGPRLGRAELSPCGLGLCAGFTSLRGLGPSNNRQARDIYIYLKTLKFLNPILPRPLARPQKHSSALLDQPSSSRFPHRRRRTMTGGYGEAPVTSPTPPRAKAEQSQWTSPFDPPKHGGRDTAHQAGACSDAEDGKDANSSVPSKLKRISSSHFDLPKNGGDKEQHAGASSVADDGEDTKSSVPLPLLGFLKNGDDTARHAGTSSVSCEARTNCKRPRSSQLNSGHAEEAPMLMAVKQEPEEEEEQEYVPPPQPAADPEASKPWSPKLKRIARDRAFTHLPPGMPRKVTYDGHLRDAASEVQRRLGTQVDLSHLDGTQQLRTVLPGHHLPRSATKLLHAFSDFCQNHPMPHPPPPPPQG